MKKLYTVKNLAVMLVLLAVTSYHAFAQTQKQTHNLLISVYDQDFSFSKTTERIIVTNDDGSQKESTIKVRRDAFQSSLIKNKEDSVMALLKPYFNDGWRIVTTSSVVIPDSNGGNILTRFFLRKEEE